MNEKVCANCRYFEDECSDQSLLCRGCDGVCMNWAPITLSYQTDNVNHPSHYETGKFECIDVMLETQGAEATKNFCLCNVFKYIYRHEGKNGIEDIRKAKWYLDKYLWIVDEYEKTTQNAIELFADGVKVDTIAESFDKYMNPPEETADGV